MFQSYNRISALSEKMRRVIGLDRAIFFAVSARLLQVAGSTGTVLMIVHFLSSTEQGYYYALLSIVNLQVVFELGLSFVVLQMAAHESANLEIDSLNGKIEGDEVALKRLASILHKTRKWYAVASLALFSGLAPFGWWFFERKDKLGHGISWHLPWLLLVLMTGLTFQVDPILSFLEGCGEVSEVARLRLFQIGSAIALAWTAMVSGHGLYAPTATLIGYFANSSFFLWRRRFFLRKLMRVKPTKHAISWGKEVWPFQWKIAVSWLCSYFTAQILTPIAFSYAGPVAAGRLGMSMGIIGAIGTIALSWMNTKAAPFGAMIRRKETDDLNRLFSKTLRQSTLFLIALMGALFLTLSLVERFISRFATRILPLKLVMLLAITGICAHVMQSEALYMRSHKEEPLLLQSIVVAILVSAGSIIMSRISGVVGLVWIYFISVGIIGLLSATGIFAYKRRKWAL